MKYRCPICDDSRLPLKQVGSSFPILKELGVIGAGSRLQKCHGCNSTDRDRLVFVYLRDYLRVFSSESRIKTILHVAPEQCIARLFLEQKGISYLPIDSMEQGYEYPDYVQKMNVLDLDVESNSVDLVVCNHVLQDIEEDTKALGEFYRVLKPGAKAILQVPISNSANYIIEDLSIKEESEREALYGQRFHCRIYNEDGFIHRVSSAGFDVNAVSISNQYLDCSLNPIEKIFVAVKNYD